MRTRIAVTGAALLLVLAGCGSGGDHQSDAAGTTPQPADIAAAARTIDVTAGPGFKFDPGTTSVKAGETVAFKVTNPDQIVHEFEVGDTAFQEHHAEEMKDMGGMQMGDDATGFSVQPGETKTIAFTFPTAGTTFYGCHEAGHYEGGMKGEIKVT
ncbi:MAG: cupredoxin domain-containing protein [Acidimicrobiales bacterium]